MCGTYQDIVSFHAVYNNLAEIMATTGSDAIAEWVDGLGESDLNALLRCLAINEEGSVAER